MSKPQDNMNKPKDYFGLFLFITIVAVGFAGMLLIMHFTGDSISISAYSPMENLSAYHIIGEEDITNTSIFYLLPHEGVIQNRSQIVGKYTIVPISSGEAIKNSMLGEVPDGLDLKDTVIISFVDASGMIFDGYLQSGDMVDITMVPQNSDFASVNFNGTILMDIKGSFNDSAQKSCTLVVALNRSEKERFFANMSNSDIRIAKVFSKNKLISANSG